jgi:hypothetical protein
MCIDNERPNILLYVKLAELTGKPYISRCESEHPEALQIIKEMSGGSELGYQLYGKCVRANEKIGECIEKYPEGYVI